MATKRGSKFRKKGIHHVYHLWDETDKMNYGGSHTSYGIEPEKDSYMGSSEYVDEAIDKGNTFIKTIVAIYPTRKKADDEEIEYLKKNNAAESEDWYNKTNRGYPYLRKVGTKNSEEHNKKISKSTKGKSKTFKSGINPKKGVPLTKEHKSNLRGPRPVLQGVPLTKEHKEKLSKAKKGVPKPEGYGEKMSKRLKQEYRDGVRVPSSSCFPKGVIPWNAGTAGQGICVAWNKGKTMDAESRKKTSETHWTKKSPEEVEKIRNKIRKTLKKRKKE